jgi:RimJ/RimL family protein N-acetyltransferase
MIRAFAVLSREAGAPRLVCDPDGRNVPSVGCLGRAGFALHGLIGPPHDRRLLMTCDLL